MDTPCDVGHPMHCGARTRNGRPCRARPMPNGRCRMHGGKSLVGPASPSYRHGRYTSFLPDRLKGRYQEAAADADLLALHEEVALTDARLADVLKRVDRGDSADLWKQLKRAMDDLENMRSLGLPDSGPLSELKRLIARGIADWAAWDEVAKLLEQRRRLVESERKRLVEMQQTITAERAMALLGVVYDVVTRHVEDKPTLAAIGADIGRLVAAQPVGTAQG